MVKQCSQQRDARAAEGKGILASIGLGGKDVGQAKTNRIHVLLGNCHGLGG